MWFSIDSCGDIKTFESQEEAKEDAENCLDLERSEAWDGWDEGVTQIMWGEVLGVAKETMRRPRTDDDSYIDYACDEVVDYAILPPLETKKESRDESE